MGIGASIFLIAIGAVLRFAVDVRTTGFDVHMVGVILMVAGVAGALISMMFWQTWGGWGRPPDDIILERERERPRHTVVIEKQSRA